MWYVAASRPSHARLCAPPPPPQYPLGYLVKLNILLLQSDVSVGFSHIPRNVGRDRCQINSVLGSYRVARTVCASRLSRFRWLKIFATYRSGLTKYLPANDEVKLEGHPEQSPILRALPDELLQVIVDHLYNSGGTWYINFSHVCRKFRDVALGLSTMWTSIHSGMSAKIVELYLIRSKEAGLSIRLVNFPYRDDAITKLDKFVSLIAPTSHRWTSFEFDPYHIPFWREFFEVLFKYLENKDVVRLESLAICVPQAYSWLIADSDVPKNILHFYSTWTAPRLKSLQVASTVPLPQFGANLISCDLRFHNTIGFIHEWLLVDLHAFLSSCHMLQELKMQVEVLAPSPSPLSELHLDSLVSFKTNLLSNGVSLAFQQLMACLHMPNIQQLLVKIKPDERCDAALINSLFKSPNDFRALRVLCLSVYGEVPVVFPLQQLLNQFQALQYLTLKVTHAEFTPTLGGVRVPPLRFLSLSNCRGMSTGLFKDIIVALRGPEAKSSLENLRIHKCRQITRNDVEAVIPGGTITSIPRRGGDLTCKLE